MRNSCSLAFISATCGGPYKIPLRAKSGPGAVVWRPRVLNIATLQNAGKRQDFFLAMCKYFCHQILFRSKKSEVILFIRDKHAIEMQIAVNHLLEVLVNC